MLKQQQFKVDDYNDLSKILMVTLGFFFYLRKRDGRLQTEGYTLYLL